jgi:hypothetical protein
MKDINGWEYRETLEENGDFVRMMWHKTINNKEYDWGFGWSKARYGEDKYTAEGLYKLFASVVDKIEARNMAKK